MTSTAILLLTLAALGLLGFPLRAWLLRLQVPPAVSLIVLGVVLGPGALDVLPETWLAHRAVLSKAAFAVLLLRAGFALPAGRIGTVLRFSLFLGTVPVVAEGAILFAGSALFGLFEHTSLCLLASFLVAAASPAVILPAVLRQIDLGRGAERNVPERLLGQTVINAFIAQTGLLAVLAALDPMHAQSDALRHLAWFPLRIAGGVCLGLLLGRLVPAPGRRPPEVPGRVGPAVVLALACAVVVFVGAHRVGLEGLFATLAFGAMLRRRCSGVEIPIRGAFVRAWSLAEIVVFVNLGSEIELHVLRNPAVVAAMLLLVFVALAARIGMAVVLLRRTILTSPERQYATLAHVPKATVQAVYGGLPLATFIARGQTDFIADAQLLVILAVVSILATAPIGAVALERTAARLLGPGNASRQGGGTTAAAQRMPAPVSGRQP